jgi:hypothetical protein
MKLSFSDNSEEHLDISNMHANQVMSFIRVRVEEKAMHAVLAEHKFVGKKLSSNWGL